MGIAVEKKRILTAKRLSGSTVLSVERRVKPGRVHSGGDS
jgi:hypothetical protein